VAREIKFKLFNRNNQKMYMFDPRWGNFRDGNGWIGAVLLSDYEKEGVRYAPSNRVQLEPDECEWLQYIGLSDKNGVGICEEDIVTYRGQVAKVIYIDSIGAFGLRGLEAWDCSFLPQMLPDIEIIGNVQEPPALLKKESYERDS